MRKIVTKGKSVTNPIKRTGTVQLIFYMMCLALTATTVSLAAEEPNLAEPMSEQAIETRKLTVPDEFTAVIGRTIGKETAPVLASDGKWHVVYELMLTNAKQVPASIKSISVLDFYDATRVLHLITSEEIVESSRNLAGQRRLEPGSPTLADGDAMLQPYESMLILIELKFDALEDVPDAIVHWFAGKAATNPGSVAPAPVAYLMVPMPLAQRTAAVIGPPLEGNNWVVINGCCGSLGAHRGAIQTVSGDLFAAQRFAIDWILIGDNGKFYEGDPAVPSNWYNYGKSVLAVADGTVIEALDELPDQPPGTLPTPDTITLATVDGNHVILDLGNGVYAFYAHLKLGSVRVRKGDTVRMGDVLGELGNSGNTSAPHLHLHLMDRPSALASDSLPLRYAGMEVVGGIDPTQWEETTEAIDDVWRVLDPPADLPLGPVLPMDLSVVNFSDSYGDCLSLNKDKIKTQGCRRK
jgi:hypothetical protein